MNKKIKFLLFSFLIFILFILIFNYFEFNADQGVFNYYSVKEDVVFSRTENSSLFTSLQLGSDYCAFDSINNTCYFTSNGRTSDSFKSKLSVLSFDKDINYVSTSGENTKSISLSLNGDNEILLFNDKYYYLVHIKFINSPIVSINEIVSLRNFNIINSRMSRLLGETIEDERSDKNIVVSIYQNNRLSNVVVPATYHVRGSSSSIYDKKSYKLEFDKDYSVLGLPDDDDWVLDAVYADKSKVRDKLSIDLWNSINDNQLVDNDLNGEFVELFIDGDYRGIYNFKEDIDKKKLKVSASGLLAKSVDSRMSSSYGAHSNNAYVKYYSDGIYRNNFEMKYYDSDCLASFLSKLDSYYSSGYDVEQLDNSFYLDNFINYKIFISAIYGFDNINKNFYYSMINDSSKILITPWDMDLTWGLDWSDTAELHSQFSLESSADIGWMDNSVIRNMDVDTYLLIKKRYWELRKDVITIDTINKYLDSYKEKLVDSGASMRDSGRWYDYDIEFEIEQIREWARLRIDFLDNYFK